MDNLEIIVELSLIIELKHLDEMIVNFLMYNIPFLFSSTQNLEIINLLPKRILKLFCENLKDNKYLVLKFFFIEIKILLNEYFVENK